MILLNDLHCSTFLYVLLRYIQQLYLLLYKAVVLPGHVKTSSHVEDVGYVVAPADKKKDNEEGKVCLGPQTSVSWCQQPRPDWRGRARAGSETLKSVCPLSLSSTLTSLMLRSG